MTTPPPADSNAALLKVEEREHQRDSQDEQERPGNLVSHRSPRAPADGAFDFAAFPCVHPDSIPATRPRAELAPLLLALGRAGIELAPHPTDAARLRHRPAVLPPDLSARLRMHRAAVRGLLAGGYAPDPHGDAGHILAERLGIADDLGMRTHPGAPAWLLAVGESMGGSCSPTTTVVHCGHGKTCGCDPAGG